MAAIKFYLANALAKSGVVLKNGTGGGAPALNENADWPMANLLVPDRYSYWRAGTAATFSIDFDLGSSKSIAGWGYTMHRTYPDDGAAQTMKLLYDNGSTYPPASWTDPSLVMTVDLNNELATISAITGRFFRFDWSFGIGTIRSMKLWLVLAADVYTWRSNDWSWGTRLTNRRVREEVRTPSGLLYSFEPAQALASDIKGGELLMVRATGAERDALRDKLTALDTRFIFETPDAKQIEATLPEGRFKSRRRFNDLYEILLSLEEHP